MFNRILGSVACIAIGTLTLEAAARQCPPNRPNNLTASQGENCIGVDLNWPNVNGANRYNVYRNDTQNGNYTFIGFSLNSNYTDHLAGPLNNYFYKVTAVRTLCLPTQNESEMSAEAEGWAGGTPNPPEEVALIYVTSNEPPNELCYVSVSTNIPPFSSSIEFWRSPTHQIIDGESFSIQTQLLGGYVSVNDWYAAENISQVYTYWTRGRTNCGAGPWSNPLAFRYLTATPSSGACRDQVELKWWAYSYGQGYRLFRDGELLQHFGSGSGSYPPPYYHHCWEVTDDPIPGKLHTYQVKVEVMTGLRASNIVQGWTTKPFQPEGMVATDGTDCGGVQISWNAAWPGAEFRVRRRSTPTGAATTLIASTTDSSWLDTTGVPGQVYYYEVNHVAVPGCTSPPAPPATDTGFRGLAQSPPTGVIASDGTLCDQVRITWNAAPGAMDYQIWRNGSIIGTSGGLTTYDDFEVVPGQVYNYTVRAFSPCGDSEQSTADAGSRAGTPQITSQPASAGTGPTGSATFSITHSGGLSPACTWQIQLPTGTWWNLTTGPLALPCGGSVTATQPTSPQTVIAITACPGVSSYSVRCVVSDICGSVVSNAAFYHICYANCDNSTGVPQLTPNDFQCFLDQFAAGSAYANCDRSSGIPILTPNDFQCFLNQYASQVGCQ